MADCVECGGPLPTQTGRGGRRKRHEQCKSKRAGSPAAGATLRDAVSAQLTTWALLDSPLGQGALRLVSAIEVAGVEQSSAIASLHKELRATMAEAARLAAPTAADPVDSARAKLHVV